MGVASIGLRLLPSSLSPITQDVDVTSTVQNFSPAKVLGGICVLSELAFPLLKHILLGLELGRPLMKPQWNQRTLFFSILAGWGQVSGYNSIVFIIMNP